MSRSGTGLVIVAGETGSLRHAVQESLKLWRVQFAGFREVISPILVGHGGRFLPLAIRDDVNVSVAVALETASDAPDAFDDLIVSYANCLHVRAHGSTLSIRRTVPFLVPTDSRPEVCLVVMEAQIVDEPREWVEVGFAANDEDRSELLVAWGRADLAPLPMFADVDPEGFLFFEL